MTVLKVGHRGAKLWEPENTIRGFLCAVRHGFEFIEFDVRLSKDGIPVVIHDETLNRTTNGRGRVRNFTVRDLKKFDAGKGERIPILDEALAFARHHKISAFVELKEKWGVEKIVRAVEKSGGRDVLISFDPEVLKHISHLNKNLSTGWVFSKRIRNRTTFFRLARSFDAVWLLGQIGTLTKSFVEQAHRWGFKIEAWVANDRRTARRIAALGVQAIATDKPDVLKGL